jgi:hypothetical protein
MNEQLNDTQIALVMKSALEYNANVVALSAHAMGNITNPKTSRQFKENLDKVGDEYAKKLKNILDGEPEVSAAQMKKEAQLALDNKVNFEVNKTMLDLGWEWKDGIISGKWHKSGEYMNQTAAVQYVKGYGKGE